jgi:hypothetical protein
MHYLQKGTIAKSLVVILTLPLPSVRKLFYASRGGAQTTKKWIIKLLEKKAT